MRASERDTYWRSRQQLNYYRRVIELSRRFAPDARSVIDVGSANCEYVLALDWVPGKFALDRCKLPVAPEITGIEADFLDFDAPRRFDLVLNLQVLEHVERPADFARRLFQIANAVVIISVPYKWPSDACAAHLHDPVDDAKLAAWTGRTPEHSEVVEDGRRARLLCVYRVPTGPERVAR